MQSVAKPPSEQTPSAGRAWIAIALSPIGIVAGVAIGYAVAAMIGVTLDPATPLQTRSFAQNTLCYGATALVALIAPVVAVVLAVHPARAGSRSGKVALVVAIVLVLGVLALVIPSLISW